jgi:alpha-galactosidase
MIRVATDSHEFVLTGGDERFRLSLTSEKISAGIDLIRLRVVSANEESQVPPAITLKWIHPAIDIHGSWNPALDRGKSFKADWMRPLRSNAAFSAPVHALFNIHGMNRLTYACSDALNTIYYTGAVREETGEFHCTVTWFQETTAPLREYEAQLLVDTRDVPYYESLEHVQQWWSDMPDYRPAPVPAAAVSPMYSTWYSMHQNVTADQVEAQCRIAKQLGMDAVIVDDGWQTDDNRRGYAYCGDWEVCPDKFPDMRRHVDAIHKLGMKFILWYSVPFVGKYSKAWGRFNQKILRFNENHGAGVLDPRYPDVRDYIIAKYEQAVRDWDLDGFKLDFIDQFYSPERQVETTIPGKDYESIPEAVDRLLTDSIARLRLQKSDIMVEFRQSYIGPAMRKYGNMFRAGDCPNDSVQNRVRTLDIRLLCGDTAAHSDMIMWHPNDPVESAALQLINALFSVPQLSVDLQTLPSDHRDMLKYWLGFCEEHRNVLLAGRLEPMRPELLYPLVSSSRGEKTIIVSYHDKLIPLKSVQNGQPSGQWIIVNGRMEEGLIVEIPTSLGAASEASIVIRDCRGIVKDSLSITLNAGLHHLPIPASGTAAITVANL